MACCSASACSRSISARSSPARSSARSPAPATKGLTVLGRHATGWLDYVRGDDRNTVNVTLNMVVDNHLKFDTIVADRRIWSVWPNAYRVHLIRRAARRTTADNPVIAFPQRFRPPTVSAGASPRRFASVKVIENGRSRRVPLIREDDYRATYAPLISLISERCTNDDLLDLALGRPMDEYRFVIALTFEQLNSRRARHLRAMVMWEEALLQLAERCRGSTSRSIGRATARCWRSRGNIARIPSASASSRYGGRRMSPHPRR